MSDDLYADAVMALARRRTGQGHLAGSRASVTMDNPLCGDRVAMDVNWTDDGRLTEVSHTVRGCALCHAAASVIGEGAPGKSIGELTEAAGWLRRFLRGEETDALRIWPGLDVFRPVREHKSRFECVLLPFKALLRGLGVEEDEKPSRKTSADQL